MEVESVENQSTTIESEIKIFAIKNSEICFMMELTMGSGALKGSVQREDGGCVRVLGREVGGRGERRERTAGVDTRQEITGEGGLEWSSHSGICAALGGWRRYTSSVLLGGNG
ncbi:hypothetical protein SLA2020_077120 [Shorea laevis]